MNAEGLLRHFGRISEAPGAVPRLRRFVLDLAVRGRLVGQVAGDEPASVLLGRIEEEKARLVKIGEIRTPRPVAPVEECNENANLPPGWDFTQLGTVIHLISGQHLKPNEYTDDEECGLPYITGPADFGSQGLEISRYALKKKAVAQKGQILLTVKGSGVGKSTVCDLPEVAISRQLMAATAIGWDQRLLRLIVNQLAATLKEKSRSLIPGISREDVRDYVFSMPPLPEQHRIVAKVDELMALCDELEAAQTTREKRRDRIVAAVHHRLGNGDDDGESGAGFKETARFFFNHLPRLTVRAEDVERLRRTILDLAVRGRLVGQDAGDEGAGATLDRIHQLKTELIKQGELRKPRVAIDSTRVVPRFEIPESWVWTTFRDVALDFRYGTSKKCSYSVEGHPVLRIPNISSGEIDTADLKFTQLAPKEVKDLSLSVGDVLMIRSNGSLNLVGRSAVVEKHAEGFFYAGYLVRARFAVGTVESKFLMALLNSRLVRDQIEIPIRSAVGLKNVNSTELGNLALPFPPVAEQRRISAKVDELMAFCTEMESQLKSGASTWNRFLEATLQMALG
ncbi:MAG: restriction endonuclease subunit S [Thermoanaerobaculales bacterium]|nr:restriction endonuclease subunit S [Thermoanaerobaculales bacterium]